MHPLKHFMKSINLTVRFKIFADLDFVELKRLAEIRGVKLCFFFRFGADKDLPNKF
jgi:hypothetical protein